MTEGANVVVASTILCESARASPEAYLTALRRFAYRCLATVMDAAEGVKPQERLATHLERQSLWPTNAFVRAAGTAGSGTAAWCPADFEHVVLPSALLVAHTVKLIERIQTHIHEVWREMRMDGAGRGRQGSKNQL